MQQAGCYYMRALEAIEGLGLVQVMLKGQKHAPDELVSLLLQGFKLFTT